MNQEAIFKHRQETKLNIILVSVQAKNCTNWSIESREGYMLVASYQLLSMEQNVQTAEMRMTEYDRFHCGVLQKFCQIKSSIMQTNSIFSLQN